MRSLLVDSALFWLLLRHPESLSPFLAVAEAPRFALFSSGRCCGNQIRSPFFWQQLWHPESLDFPLLVSRYPESPSSFVVHCGVSHPSPLYGTAVPRAPSPSVWCCDTQSHHPLFGAAVPRDTIRLGYLGVLFGVCLLKIGQWIVKQFMFDTWILRYASPIAVISVPRHAAGMHGPYLLRPPPEPDPLRRHRRRTGHIRCFSFLWLYCSTSHVLALSLLPKMDPNAEAFVPSTPDYRPRGEVEVDPAAVRQLDSLLDQFDKMVHLSLVEMISSPRRKIVTQLVERSVTPLALTALSVLR